MGTKHTKQYAKELALRNVAQIHEKAFVDGYMKAIEETAAPNLLEACEELISLLRFHGYLHSAEINKAEQAIKKAK